MANLSMGRKQLESLTHEQRDHLLLQLLAEKTDKLNDTSSSSSTPLSEASKTLMKHVGHALLNDVENGRIQAALQRSTQVLKSYFGAMISDEVDDVSPAIYEDVERRLMLEIVQVLDCDHGHFRGQTFDHNVHDLLDEGVTWIGIDEENENILELMAQIKAILPKLVRNSISWEIDTIRINDGLSTIISDFVSDRILPVMADKTSRAEVDLGLATTLVPSFDMVLSRFSSGLSGLVAV
ncbi:hypothetical protein [Halocynthiibacter namhaensis]|uniref:hypothetical protein n=1 Tax=Halocynthiibacter namhaensis TaxID=1290553 RepID=UPI0005798129|nr:hypothetical protein [Halocynthiibacter namhaensis]